MAAISLNIHKERLQKALLQQTEMLRTSARNFDAGNKWEVLRLSSSVFQLMIKAAKNTPIVFRFINEHDAQVLSAGEQIGHSSASETDSQSTRVRATFTIHDKNFPQGVMPRLARLGTPAGQMPYWYPALHLASRKKLLSYYAWKKEPIFNIGGRNISRFQFVKTMRDQDGGAHFDTNIKDQAYSTIKSLGLPQAKATVWVD